METSSMNYCPHCGAEAHGESLFCASCGRPLVGGPAASSQLPYLISPSRIVLMSIVSLGLYVYYWFYKTWKHYRDHTGAEAYPVWHGLTLLVPVYGSFRAHAHMRTYVELAVAQGVATRLAPGWAFAVVLYSAFGSSILSFIIPVIAYIIAFIAEVWMMLHAQSSIDAYWRHVSGGRLTTAPIGVGEILVMIIGGLTWGSILLLILFIFVLGVVDATQF